MTQIQEPEVTEKQEQLPPSIRYLKTAQMTVLYGLLVYYVVYVFGFTPLPTFAVANFFISGVFCLPLAAFIPGLRGNRIRSHAWLSFFILIYFMHGVVIAFDPAYRVMGIIESVLTMTLFCLLMLFIRQYRQFAQTSLFTRATAS